MVSEKSGSHTDFFRYLQSMKEITVCLHQPPDITKGTIKLKDPEFRNATSKVCAMEQALKK